MPHGLELNEQAPLKNTEWVRAFNGISSEEAAVLKAGKKLRFSFYYCEPDWVNVQKETFTQDQILGKSLAETLSSCECAKEKFNFISHASWCPEFVAVHDVDGKS